MIFRGPYPEVGIPEVSITSFVLQNAGSLGEKAELIEGETGRTITYAQLADSIRRAAAGLSARGFKQYEIFGILSPNVPEFAIAFHAVATLGGVCTTINPLYTEPEIGQQLKDAGARFLVTVPECLAKARAAANEANIEEVFVFGEAEAQRHSLLCWKTMEFSPNL